MTSSFIKTVRAFDEVASTSDIVRGLIESPDIELPLLVTTNRQTAGRGRGENRWWSDEGSLTFSIAFSLSDFNLRRDHESRIALVTAVAISRACASLAPLGIRWPNDVESGGKKLGGLLPESVATSLGPRFVLGIGLNVSTRLDQAPAEVRAMATSLSELAIRPLDKHLILSGLLDQLAECLRLLADDDPSLAKAWRELDLLLDQPVRLRLGDVIIEGVGAGIAPDGSLKLRTEQGERAFHAGQVLRTPYHPA